MNKLIEIIRPYFEAIETFGEEFSEHMSKQLANELTSSGLLRPNIEDVLKETPEIKERLKEIAARMDTESSEINSAKELLKTYNRWRRGDSSVEHPHPTDIGRAIDKLTL